MEGIETRINIEEIKAFYQTNQKELLEELKSFLKIPSISTDSKYDDSIKEGAFYLSELLKNKGAQNVSIMTTNGHPVVYGEYLKSENLPTILIYGHYDVQPPDPIELWTNPPFDPIIKNGRIYARGAADDKGQLFMHLVVLSYFNHIGFPCNLKFLFEGEEEIGSISLERFISDNKSLLSNDLMLISDTAILGLDQPSIICGTKGIVYFELNCKGPKKDIHSGIYGGGVQNPFNALSEIIHRIKPCGKRIQIPGFYDEIQFPKEMDLGHIDFYSSALKQELGVKAFVSDESFDPIQTNYFLPSFDIHGMWGGYQEEGAKTIIPSQATAKCSFRISPGQNTKKVLEQLNAFLRDNEIKGVEFELNVLSTCEPSYISPESDAFKAANNAFLATLGNPVIPTRMGGSLPIIPMMQSILGSEVILLGFGTDEDNIHSPDENFKLNHFEKGIETIACFVQQFNDSYSNQ